MFKKSSLMVILCLILIFFSCNKNGLNDSTKIKTDINKLTIKIKKDPENIELILERGRLHLLLGFFNVGSRYSNHREIGKKNAQSAIDDFTRAERLDPHRYEPYSLRAKGWWMLDEYEKAIADFTKSIRLQPSKEDDYLNRGRCYTEIGAYDDAMRDFTFLINRGEATSVGYRLAALRLRSELYEKQQKYREAIEDLTAAIQLKTASRDIILFERGKLYLKLGEESKAQEDFKESCLLEPNYNSACGLISK